MALKLITFDMTGTLLRFKQPPQEVYSAAAKMFGLHVSTNEVKMNFKETFKQMNSEHPNFGAETNLGWTQWWMRVVKSSLKNASLQSKQVNLDPVALYLIKLYSSAQPWEMCPGIKETLNELKKRSIVLGVVSNFDPRLEQILRNAGLSHYFDFVLSSYDTGSMKPNSKIFDTALAKASEIGETNLKPSECCHVGDTYETDYVGARNSNWNAILLSHSDTRHTTLQPENVCSDMRSLIAHLNL